VIDPTILRDCPERYAREPFLRATLEPSEVEDVQDAIARRYLERVTKVLEYRPKPQLSGVFSSHHWRRTAVTR
jgi:hypothetical protein